MFIKQRFQFIGIIGEAGVVGEGGGVWVGVGHGGVGEGAASAGGNGV